ncbi:MAG TPA: aminotransferase class V-fold PLP-dependent enzyme [Burkholderiales bacterium]
MTAFGRALRRRFPLEAGTAFVNHGSYGAAPRRVLAAAARWRALMERNPDRFMREILPGALRAAAARLAAFLHARADDLAFVENATTGVNAVLRSIELRRGDEILATSHAYGAVRQAIRECCRRTGARLVEARIVLPVPGLDDLIFPVQKAFSQKTKLLVLDHVASPTGLVFPVKRLARFARARGARVLVDGAHAPGQIALDIPALGVDWYAGNCHKWMFAPKGSGFLWARLGAQRGLHPPVISHGYGGGFTAEFDWTGTRDFSNWLSVPDGIGFLKELNSSKVRTYNHRLVTTAAVRIAEAWNTPVDGPAGLHGSMMAIRLPGRLQGREPARLMAELLRRNRVVVAVMQIEGELWARISAQAYNSAKDYDRLPASLR